MSEQDKNLYNQLIQSGHTDAQAQALVALHNDPKHSTDLSHLNNSNVNVIQVEANKK